MGNVVCIVHIRLFEVLSPNLLEGIVGLVFHSVDSVSELENNIYI